MYVFSTNVACNMWRNSTLRFLLLTERRNENNSIHRLGIKLTTVALIVKCCAAAPRRPH